MTTTTSVCGSATSGGASSTTALGNAASYPDPSSESVEYNGCASCKNVLDFAKVIEK